MYPPVNPTQTRCFFQPRRLTCANLRGIFHVCIAFSLEICQLRRVKSLGGIKWCRGMLWVMSSRAELVVESFRRGSGNLSREYHMTLPSFGRSTLTSLNATEGCWEGLETFFYTPRPVQYGMKWFVISEERRAFRAFVYLPKSMPFSGG